MSKTNPAGLSSGSRRRAPAKTATAAWETLLEIGGFEKDGRDADTVRMLAERLDPLGLDLARGLAAVSIPVFLTAIFGIVSPFSEMSRDILAFFREADATRGRDEWRLDLGEHHELLSEDFRNFIEAVEQAADTVEHAALDFETAWKALEVVERATGTGPGRGPSRRSAPSRAPRLPSVQMLLARGSPASADLCACVEVMATVVDGFGQLPAGRERLPILGRLMGRFGPDHEDAFARGTVAGLATDDYLERSATALEASLRLGGSQARELEYGLARVLKPLARRCSVIRVSEASLERILSLPVWGKRFEVYAVWIATELRRSLDDRPFEIAHREGVIDFPFRDTPLARVGTAGGEVEIVLERTTALAEPIGKGRTGHVQPDYSAWRAVEGRGLEVGDCPLVVEVKHYKKEAVGSFSDVLVDYARAHPAALTVLVNYGRVGTVLERVESKASSLRSRCFAIGGLAPGNEDARAEFRSIVRMALGPPPMPPGCVPVVVDVSSSMMEGAGSVRGLVVDWLRRRGSSGQERVVLVDESEVARGTATEMAVAVEERAFRLGTTLTPTLSQLMLESARLFVLTDVDGLAQVQCLQIECPVVERIGAAFLLEVGAPA